MLMVVYCDRTFYNPLEYSSLHPIQWNITDVQYSKRPTQRETRGGRARFEVEAQSACAEAAVKPLPDLGPVWKFHGPTV